MTTPAMTVLPSVKAPTMQTFHRDRRESPGHALVVRGAGYDKSPLGERDSSPYYIVMASATV